MSEKILVTGMSGLIGSAVRTALQGEVELSALNRSAVDGIPTTRADLVDLDAIRPAFEGVDTVIHLGAKAGNHYTWQELLSTNVIGTHNVLQAASDSGCSRVVFASSGATVSGYETDEPYLSLVSGAYDNIRGPWKLISPDMATRPTGVYGSTKVWGEALCRNFVDSTNLSVFCIRIGLVTAADKPTSARAFSIWCSQRDIVDLIVRTARRPLSQRWGVFFGTSRNRWGYRDLTQSQSVLGYTPSDEAEAHR